MAVNDKLVGFIESALAKGVARDEIRQVLCEAGWEKREISSSLEAFEDIDFPVPVPRKQFSLSARETVFSLALFLMLYISSWGLVCLAFGIVDAIYYDGSSYVTIETVHSNIRYWAAYTIVFTPVFIFLFLKGEAKKKTEHNCSMSSPRQWATYLTILISGLTALINLIVLLYNFLDGDVSVALFCKILVVAIVSGGVLVFYYRDIIAFEKAKRDEED